MAGKALPFMGPVINSAITKAKSLLFSQHGGQISKKVANLIGADHSQV